MKTFKQFLQEVTQQEIHGVITPQGKYKEVRAHIEYALKNGYDDIDYMIAATNTVRIFYRPSWNDISISLSRNTPNALITTINKVLKNELPPAETYSYDIIDDDSQSYKYDVRIPTLKQLITKIRQGTR